MGYIKELLPKMIQYRLARQALAGPGMPINLTFSVTNVCQSRCKTCHIWELYREEPDKRQEELSLPEIQKIFQSMGHVYIFNISGGEPFLRDDLADIIEAACQHLTPGIIHIPTNAIAQGRIEKSVTRILSMLKAKYPSVRLTVKPSLDHVGEKHDDIRGVRGNFKKVISLFHKLKAMESDHPQFHAELGTVISAWNVGDIKEIAQFVTGLGVDSYRNEIAEERAEMFNRDFGITPSAGEYKKAVEYFTQQIRQSMENHHFFHKITNAFRLVYYDTAIRILEQEKQVIACYAGISNAHMSPYGDIWACCTLGYDHSMGNLREMDYHFPSLWNSARAKGVRAYIREGNCHCPLANQTYSNLLLHGPSLLKVFQEIFLTRTHRE